MKKIRVMTLTMCLLAIIGCQTKQGTGALIGTGGGAAGHRGGDPGDAYRGPEAERLKALSRLWSGAGRRSPLLQCLRRKNAPRGGWRPRPDGRRPDLSGLRRRDARGDGLLHQLRDKAGAERDRRAVTEARGRREEDWGAGHALYFKRKGKRI